MTNKKSKTWKVRFVNSTQSETITCDYIEWPSSRNEHYNFHRGDELIAKVHMSQVLIVVTHE